MVKAVFLSLAALLAIIAGGAMLWPLLRAGKRATFAPSWKYDAIGIALGAIAAIGVIHGHRWLFGVAVP